MAATQPLGEHAGLAASIDDSTIPAVVKGTGMLSTKVRAMQSHLSPDVNVTEHTSHSSTNHCSDWYEDTDKQTEHSYMRRFSSLETAQQPSTPSVINMQLERTHVSRQLPQRPDCYQDLVNIESPRSSHRLSPVLAQARVKMPNQRRMILTKVPDKATKSSPSAPIVLRVKTINSSSAEDMHFGGFPNSPLLCVQNASSPAARASPSSSRKISITDDMNIAGFPNSPIHSFQNIPSPTVSASYPAIKTTDEKNIGCLSQSPRFCFQNTMSPIFRESPSANRNISATDDIILSSVPNSQQPFCQITPFPSVRKSPSAIRNSTAASASSPIQPSVPASSSVNRTLTIETTENDIPDCLPSSDDLQLDLMGSFAMTSSQSICDDLCMPEPHLDDVIEVINGDIRDKVSDKSESVSSQIYARQESDDTISGENILSQTCEQSKGDIKQDVDTHRLNIETKGNGSAANDIKTLISDWSEKSAIHSQGGITEHASCSSTCKNIIHDNQKQTHMSAKDNVFQTDRNTKATVSKKTSAVLTSNFYEKYARLKSALPAINYAGAMMHQTGHKDNEATRQSHTAVKGNLDACSYDTKGLSGSLSGETERQSAEQASDSNKGGTVTTVSSPKTNNSAKIPLSQSPVMAAVVKNYNDYLMLSASEMHEYEIANAKEFKYCADMYDVICDRDLYVWQLIDEL